MYSTILDGESGHLKLLLPSIIKEGAALVAVVVAYAAARAPGHALEASQLAEEGVYPLGASLAAWGSPDSKVNEKAGDRAYRLDRQPRGRRHDAFRDPPRTPKAARLGH